jgi:hypothetical protein
LHSILSQTSGAAVALSSATEARPTFTAPVVPAGQPSAALVFSLQVSDAYGSSTSTVTVSVSPAAAATSAAPVASAGPNQAAESEVQVTLDGSGSSDPNGRLGPIMLGWSLDRRAWPRDIQRCILLGSWARRRFR